MENQPQMWLSCSSTGPGDGAWAHGGGRRDLLGEQDQRENWEGFLTLIEGHRQGTVPPAPPGRSARGT